MSENNNTSDSKSGAKDLSKTLGENNEIKQNREERRIKSLYMTEYKAAALSYCEKILNAWLVSVKLTGIAKLPFHEYNAKFLIGCSKCGGKAKPVLELTMRFCDCDIPAICGECKNSTKTQETN